MVYSRGSVLIELAPMTDLDHDDGIVFDAETDAVVASPQAMPTGQGAGQGLGATDSRPGFQPLEDLADPFADTLGSLTRSSSAAGVTLT